MTWHLLFCHHKGAVYSIRSYCGSLRKLYLYLFTHREVTVTLWAGNGESTIAHAQEAINIFEETEISLSLDIAWVGLGAGYYLRGEYDKAIDLGEKGLMLAKELGLPLMVSWSYWYVAIIHRAAGNLTRARECTEEALRISKECKGKPIEGMAQVLLGCISWDLTPTTIDEAQQQIKNGIAILEQKKLKALSACGYLHLGEFFANAGRKEEALESLKKAEALYREMEVTSESYWLVRTQDALKRLELNAGTTH